MSLSENQIFIFIRLRADDGGCKDSIILMAAFYLRLFRIIRMAGMFLFNQMVKLTMPMIIYSMKVKLPIYASIPRAGVWSRQISAHSFRKNYPHMDLRKTR